MLLQAFYGATGFACAATVMLLTLALTASVTGALSARGTTRLSASERRMPRAARREADRRSAP